MSKQIWKLPVPATAITRGPFFKVLLKRQCEISFLMDWDGSEEEIALLFDGVEAFECTYLTSLGSIDREQRKEAYGAVISLEASPWLGKVKGSYLEYCDGAHLPPKDLQHLMVCFDDGPCYEIICADFAVRDGVSHSR